MAFRIRALTVAFAAAVCVSAADGERLVEARPAPPLQHADPAITLRIIVVASAEAAERIAGRIEAGESFAVLARTESNAPSAEAGGWLGRLPLSQLRPEVRAILDGLAPGRVTPVIRIPTGFAIFRVEDDEGTDARVDRAIASAGAVKYAFEVSGFGEAHMQ